MSHYRAILDFRQARRKARREKFLARFSGRSAELLPFSEVRRKLRARSGRPIGLRNIPIDSIIGSEGRYLDFSRSFLPLIDGDESRWSRIQTRATDLAGLPPIEVYKIGETYFVHDGNHRVSVARELGATHIEAFVTELTTRVPLTPDIQPDELILKAEYADFMEKTRLNEIRPEVDLSVTVPGRYRFLLEHIEVHRYYMGLEEQRDIPYEKAVARWHDTIYLPVIQVVRAEQLIRDFPERTETDLYLWVSEHRALLEEALGWKIEAETAATALVEDFSPRAQRRFARAASRLLDALTPDELEGGPSPGRWRQVRAEHRHKDCLFTHVLVPVTNDEQSWAAVAQAAEIACRESAGLLGLHVVPSESEIETAQSEAMKARFEQQCEAAGISGRFTIEVGKVARTIWERSRWADLIVVGLAHPPAAKPIAKLGSGFRTLIRRCPAPILAVPGACSSLNRPLLAYDGSPKAREALYIAAYLASRGQVPLLVVYVADGSQSASDALTEAGEYLETRGVEAELVQEQGSVSDAILKTARNSEADLILMGGYGYNPLIEVVLGSAVDEVLRTSRRPILICR